MKDDYQAIPPGSQLLEETFKDHKNTCHICLDLDTSKTGELHKLCLAGSVLWKRENAIDLPKPKILRGWKLQREIEGL